jgi:diaminohydroxyphosphoribosylaminopyrimidine deaminase / 5-amino-6-(5-phosphoribosylamino)uracil reductase
LQSKDFMFTARDHAMMQRALRLADKARCWARPNPHVGCVLARGDAVVGEGFTQPIGGDHAEIRALRDAGDAARGSTVYVTLEPCAHHGRTPPCVDALIEAGVQRVIAAITDPHPRVSGQGFARLRAAGISTATGLLEPEVEDQLAGFLLRQRRGRGRLRIKMAASLDGRTAMASGESQWITGPAARQDVQRLRADSCAIVTGIGTVLADDCALTVRDAMLEGLHLPKPARRALRVVLDSRLQTPRDAAVLAGEQPSLIVHSDRVSVPSALARQPRLAVASADSGLALAPVLDALARWECNEILLESGPKLAGAMLREGLADEVVVYLAPKLLGSSGRSMFDLALERMAEAHPLELVEHEVIGPDLRLRYRARPAHAATTVT